MISPVRVGLISEGEAELGTSVPFIYDPKQGGKVIEREHEGALHTLIRRELLEAGLPDCVFVQRHRTSMDNAWRLRMGSSVINPKYLAQTVIAWKPAEVDIIVVVVDEDENPVLREREINTARAIIIERHIDNDGNRIHGKHAIGIAVKSFDTWLIADSASVQELLKVTLPDLPFDLETLPGESANPTHGKSLLDAAISTSTYAPQNPRVKNIALEARWELAHVAKLADIRERCKRGYFKFVTDLLAAVQYHIQGYNIDAS